MKVIIIEANSKEPEVYETGLNSLRELLSYWKFTHGSEFTERFVINKYKYIIINGENLEEVVTLKEETLFSSFAGYQTLLIVSEVSGSMGTDAVASAFFSSAAEWAAASAAEQVGIYMLTAAINIGLAYGTQLLINALSKTPVFSGDPIKGTVQMSNLFGSAIITVQQGGCVPLLYGYAFAGGTLICSSVTTKQG